MVEEEKKTYSNTKTQLSLAAAMFFSPLVQYLLRNSERNLSEAERKFVQGYIFLWYIMIAFWILSILFGVLHYFFLHQSLHIISTVSIFILLVSLIVSVVSILSDINLLQIATANSSDSPLHIGEKKHIILTYLPFYNIYLRYKSHSFEKPNRRIKESLFIWIAIFWTSIIGNERIAVVAFMGIIIRISSLMADIDIVPLYIKRTLNTLFFKNPEEIWAYVSWFFRYIGKYIIHLWKPMPAYSITQDIQQEKLVYQEIINPSTKKIIGIEYIVWIGLLGGSVFLFAPFSWTYYIMIGLLLWRYITMFIQLHHLPHLPIAREIVLFVYTIYTTLASFILRK